MIDVGYYGNFKSGGSDYYLEPYDKRFPVASSFFFILRRRKILLDHWPKPFKVRVNTFPALEIQEKG
jgi:hypothetical protein